MFKWRGRVGSVVLSALIPVSTPPSLRRLTARRGSISLTQYQTLCKQDLNGNVVISFSNRLFCRLAINCAFSTRSKIEDSDNDGEASSDNEEDPKHGCEILKSIIWDEEPNHRVEKILEILRDFGQDAPRAKQKLDEFKMPLSAEMVEEVLSRIRNDWSAAFTFFLWAQKQSGYTHSTRHYHSMISILGKMRKFDTAWALVDEMKSVFNPPMVTPQTLLIIIRKYSAAHDVAKAIGTFYAFKRYGFKVELKEFQDLLSALCRYKNVQDAEHLLICNENVFAFDTKSFNIVLNGWCTAVGNLTDAKRFWNVMIRRNVSLDVVSYQSMISCYSKAGSLNDVLKMFDQMKKENIIPDVKVYNSVIYALAKKKRVKEAVCLMREMEEKACVPNVVTYNSLIKPLCKAYRLEDAWFLFHDMLRRGLSPSISTYHAFLAVSRTTKAVFQILEQMKETGCRPVNDTCIMLIRKFCRWRQHDHVFKIWKEMNTRGLSPDRSSYTVLIHGLFLNGKLDEAFKYYNEMKLKGFIPEPNIDAIHQAWLSDTSSRRAPMTMAECVNGRICQTHFYGTLDSR